MLLLKGRLKNYTFFARDPPVLRSPKHLNIIRKQTEIILYHFTPLKITKNVPANYTIGKETHWKDELFKLAVAVFPIRKLKLFPPS